MSYETREYMIRVIRKCIDTEVEMEIVREKISKSLCISLRNIFDRLDWLNRGFLTKNEIKRIID